MKGVGMGYLVGEGERYIWRVKGIWCDTRRDGEERKRDMEIVRKGRYIWRERDISGERYSSVYHDNLVYTSIMFTIYLKFEIRNNQPYQKLNDRNLFKKSVNLLMHIIDTTFSCYVYLLF